MKIKCGFVLLALNLFASAYPQVQVTRLNENNPIIDRNLDPCGWTVNGPSMLQIPDWIPATEKADPKAKYYIYYSGHTDPYIKLAWSENIEGPYNAYNPGEGVFHLNNYLPPDRLKISHHVASPDVHIDSIHQRFIMYFHAGELTWNNDSIHSQKTVVALSDNGVDFNGGLQDAIVCPYYARVFRYNDNLYAVCRDGLYMAGNLENPWDCTEDFNQLNQHLWKKAGDPFLWIPQQERHFALLKENETLHVMFSRISSRPEHIEYSKIRLMNNTWRWKPSKPLSILFPEYKWEGISYPIVSSEEGPQNRAQELRDPYLFLDKDSSLYLLYCGTGEKSIGIAKIEGLLGSTDLFGYYLNRCPDNINVFPNPSSDGIFHITGIHDRAIIEVVSLTGSVILNRTTTDMENQILDLSNYKNVSLILHIIDDSYTCWKKIMLL